MKAITLCPSALQLHIWSADEKPYISSVKISRKYFLSMANCICQIQFVQIVWVNYSPLDFNINGLEIKDDKRGWDKAIYILWNQKDEEALEQIQLSVKNQEIKRTNASNQLPTGSILNLDVGITQRAVCIKQWLHKLPN